MPSHRTQGKRLEFLGMWQGAYQQRLGHTRQRMCASRERDGLDKIMCFANTKSFGNGFDTELSWTLIKSCNKAQPFDFRKDNNGDT